MTGDKLARLPLIIFLVVFATTSVLFVIAGLAMNDFERAWNILIGATAPFGRDSALGVALSVLGYLLIPAVVGLVVADGIVRFTRKRLLTLPEAKEEIREMLEQALTKDG